MNKQDIKSHIAVWKEHLTHWESELETAKKYDDFGGRETAEEMIRYSNRKIDELEQQLIKKGA